MYRIRRSNILTVALVVWIVGLAVFHRSEIALGVRSLCADALYPTTMWKVMTSTREPVLGRTDARFRIIEFSDYECPYCALADRFLVHFYHGHPNDVVIYRYDVPLQQIHRYAYGAAIAANCAARQSVEEPYQSLLFQNQKKFVTLDWIGLASQSGVRNREAFGHCVKEEEPRAKILKDMKTAESLGMAGTPSFIINGKLYKEGMTEERLESLFREPVGKQHYEFLRDLLNMQFVRRYVFS